LIIVAAFEAPAVIAGFDDVAMMGQAVEPRGYYLVAEYARSLAEREVRGASHFHFKRRWHNRGKRNFNVRTHCRTGV
jgi:hypothetical protein